MEESSGAGSRKLNTVIGENGNEENEEEEHVHIIGGGEKEEDEDEVTLRRRLTEEDEEEEEEDGSGWEEEQEEKEEARRMVRRRADFERVLQLRRFLSTAASEPEVGLALTYALTQGDFKNLTRRAAGLVALLQAQGGADALTVTDALFSHAQRTHAHLGELQYRLITATSQLESAARVSQQRSVMIGDLQSVLVEAEEEHSLAVGRLEDQHAQQLRRVEEAHREKVRGLQRAHTADKTGLAELRDRLQASEAHAQAMERSSSERGLETDLLKDEVAKLQREAGQMQRELGNTRNSLTQSQTEARDAHRLADTKAKLVRELRDDIRSLTLANEEYKGRSADVSHQLADAKLKRAAALERAEEAFGKLVALAKAHQALEEELSATQSRWEDERDAHRDEMSSLQASLSKQQRASERGEVEHARSLLALEDQLEEKGKDIALVEGRLEASQMALNEAREELRDRDELGRELRVKISVLEQQLSEQAKHSTTLSATVEELSAAVALGQVEIARREEALDKQNGIISYINALSANGQASEVIQHREEKEKGVGIGAAAAAAAAGGGGGGAAVAVVRIGQQHKQQQEEEEEERAAMPSPSATETDGTSAEPGQTVK